MDRRKFLKRTGITLLGLGAVTAGGSAFFHHHFSSRNNANRIITFSSLDEALKELDAIQKAQEVKLQGDWSLYQNLIHCNQSIAYSLTGYPENKSKFFQNTIGSLVFDKFASQGYMRHNRNEAIPKAPDIAKNGELKEAFATLRATIEGFQKFEGALAPHFAYGKLSKSEYMKAHSMHLADHFAIMEY